MYSKLDFELEIEAEADEWKNDIIKMWALQDGSYGIGRAGELNSLLRRQNMGKHIVVRR